MQHPSYDKSVSQFWPLAALPAQECERHYVQVHTPFARRMLREREQVVSYAPARVVGELDLGGGWAQRPRAFRFITLRYLAGRSLELPPDLHERIVQDHRSFLRDLRAFPVREQVLVDRLRGQTRLEKYVVALDRRPETDPEEAARYLDKQLDVLVEQAEGAFGLRQVVVDHVQGEAETEAVDEPGQRPVGRLLPSTPRQAFVEVLFDHHDWASEWFARPAVRAVVQDAWWDQARVYRLDEECGMDRR